ncbi:MAG: type I-C CRISPR-associated protein Cas8c/Csd1 [Lachnospiraceae bacterium]
MVLQALVRYYDILAQEEESEISPYGYCRASISYALNISKEGELLEILPLKHKVMRGKKEVEIPRSMIIPQQVKKSSNIHSNFLCENSAYVLGIDKKGKSERTKLCFEAFRTLHTEILSKLECEEAKALLNFLNIWNVEEAGENEIVKPFFAELTAGANIVFKLDHGAYLQECPMIKKAWDDSGRKTEKEGIMQCLVTGEQAPIARLHPAIKGVKGAQTMGASIVSFNAKAYESYGGDNRQGFNAPISEKAAFSYGTVLNHLISDRAHTLSVGDTTVVYWAEVTNKMQQDVGALFFAPEDLEADEGKQTITNKEARKLVGSILEKIAKGKKISEEAIVEEDALFYVLGLAPNAARLSIRFFTQSTFGDFVKNITRHYEDLSIEKQFESEPNFISPWRMLNQTVSPNAKDKSASPLLGGAVMRAILEGSAYPVSLLQMVMIRIKAERDINYYKSAVIKAYLIRKNNKTYEEVLQMSLNPESKNTAYLLGRLFSVLEKIQKDATPEINTTIKDRYFSSACATPVITFPSLLKLSQHHIAKAEYGYTGENKMAEILDKLEVEDKPFPTHLSLEEQGIFVLGYYHQRNDFYKKKIKSTEEEE